MKCKIEIKICYNQLNMRKEGYYWVKCPSGWQIAKWWEDVEMFSLTGSDKHYKEWMFEDVKEEMIAEPN